MPGEEFDPASAKNDQLVPWNTVASPFPREHRIAGCHSIDWRVRVQTAGWGMNSIKGRELAFASTAVKDLATARAARCCASLTAVDASARSSLMELKLQFHFQRNGDDNQNP